MARKNPFGIPQPLLDDLVENRWLPLIGAGFSLNAELPMGASMPTWNDLGKDLEEEVRLLSPGGGALETISTYGHEHGRQALITRLRTALHVDTARAGAAHRAFAHLPFDIVATTNFDNLVEDGYLAVARRLNVVVREDQLARGVARGTVTLVKAHGDLDHEPELVATEEDYDAFLDQRPLLATYLSNLLITRTAVLIGYSMSDPDWRQILAAVRSRLGRSQRKVYAFVVKPSRADVARFERRGVEVIPLKPAKGQTYGEMFAALFRFLRDYVAQHSIDVSVIRDEAVREALLGSGRRIVLFVVPEDRLAFYRAQVFPEVRPLGLAPATAFDVDPRGGSFDAAVLALLRRAAAVVVDMTRGGGAFEAFLAHGAFLDDKRIRTAVIVGAGVAAPEQRESVQTFHPDDPDAPPLEKWLVGWLKDIAPTLAPATDEVPPQTPNARILAAVARLEDALREHYDDDQSAVHHFVWVMADFSVPEDEFLEVVKLRGDIVHSGIQASADQAAMVERVVEDVTRRLPPPRTG